MAVTAITTLAWQMSPSGWHPGLVAAATPDPSASAADATPAPTGSAATPTPAPTELDEVTLEQALRQFGLDPLNMPVFDLRGGYLFLFILALAATVLLLRAIYRGMQRPRLTLTYHEDRPPTASRGAVLRYLATPVFLVPMWFMTVLGVLVLAANRTNGFRPADELVVAAAVVIGGSRLLAHVNLEGAHELAKSVPLTLVSLILISGQLITLNGFVVVVFLLLINVDSLSYFVLLLALFDVMFTAAWLIMRRVQWDREQDQPGEAPRGVLARVWHVVVAGWAPNASGPSLAQPQTVAGVAGGDVEVDSAVRPDHDAGGAAADGTDADPAGVSDSVG